MPHQGFGMWDPELHPGRSFSGIHRDLHGDNAVQQLYGDGIVNALNAVSR
jgi:hypothetical protein